MFRYCVLSIPRTGSTWLTNGIGYTYHRFKNYINLHEFITPFTRVYSRYELDENNIITEFTEVAPYEVSNPSNFVNSRLDILLKGDVNQPLVLKYMYMTRPLKETNDLDNLQRIQDHKIIIVNLIRDTFDSTISSAVAGLTGIHHKWETDKGEFWSTTKGTIPKINIPNIIVPALDFKATYFQMKQADNEKQKMAELLGCIMVNYNNLRFDCINNKIPFQNFTHSRKVYDVDYREIIQNYDQLLEIKEQVDNMISTNNL